jgi:predicted permease
MESLRRVPGVTAASLASTVPFGDFHEEEAVEPVGSSAASGRRAYANATYRVVGASYFRTLGLPMLRGREFSDTEETSASAPRVAIIDAECARRLFGADDPVGQMIRFVQQPGVLGAVDTTPMEVVGVAAPIRDALFDRAVRPAIYVPWGRHYRANANLHIQIAHAGSEREVLEAVRAAIHAADARLPLVTATSMTAFHERSLQLWVARTGGQMFLLVGGLALLLAVVGLYGVKSYVVSQRTREIGIRMALGARPGDVLGMMMKEGAVIAAAGVAVGLPLAALLGLALSSLLYGVKPLDPLVFATAPALLAFAALVATWIPARRATRVTPLTALRAD